MSINIGYTNLGQQQNQVMQALASMNQPKGQKGHFSEMFNNRWQIILQQIAQFADPQSLPIQAQALDDSAKANAIEQFAKQIESKMDAKNMNADYQAALNYLS